MEFIQSNFGLFGIGGGALVGAASGALVFYLAETTVKDAIDKQGWVLPVLGGTAGMVAGGLLAGKFISK